MKKILFSLLTVLLLSGCGENLMNTPTKKVEALLNNYQTLNEDVINDLDYVIDEEVNFNTTQRDTYKDIMKKHYQNLNYEIKDEVINGNSAVVTVEIEVTDFSKVNSQADTYYTSNPDEFNDENGLFDASKLVDYQLDLLNNSKDKVKYTLEINVTKENEEWKVQPLSDTDLDKINGIYQY